jgi:ribosomal protein S18 acetylase RimI-like enzyme
MKNIDIKKITLLDIAELQKIGKQTFYETFAAGNTEEDMQLYLEESFKIAKLMTELTNPNSQFYFAKFNKKVIGYLKINVGQAQTELQEDSALEIERIYVLKEFYGKSVGQILYNTAFEIAKKAKVYYIWLGVWEENSRALCFYKKNGFVEFDKHIFRVGNDLQTDIMMKLKLI